MNLNGRSLLATTDLTQAEILALIELALAQKQGRIPYGTPFASKSAALLFFDPSLRTRLSMATAINRLGGHPLVVDAQQGLWRLETQDNVVMDQDKVEHVRDAAPVLSQYVDMIAIRSFPRFQSLAEDLKEPFLSHFAAHAERPIINLESALHHPCQALADMLTIRETLGGFKKRRAVLAWSWHPKALPLGVPNSFALAAAQCGMDLTIACPPTHILPEPVLAQIRHEAAAHGNHVTVSHDLDDACAGADIVYAKSWSSALHYGNPEAEALSKRHLRDWIIDERRVPPHGPAYFMHCLPVRRNVEVTDAVIDGPRSLTLREAENRLYAQMSLIAAIFGDSLACTVPSY